MADDTHAMSDVELLNHIIDNASFRKRECTADGGYCRHYAGYLDSGDNEICHCHFLGKGNPSDTDCEGQPEPYELDQRGRMIQAILKEFERIDQ